MLKTLPYRATTPGTAAAGSSTDSLRTILVCLMSCLLIVLSGCASGPRTTTDQSAATEQGVRAADRYFLEGLLNEANTLDSPQSEARYYEAARFLYYLTEFEEAGELLNSLDIESLPLELSADIISLRADIQIQLGQAQQALTLLSDERLSVPQLSDDQQNRIRELRASALAASGQHLLSAQERIFLDNRLLAERREANHEHIWTSLDNLDVPQLTQLSETSVSYEFQAWYELALISKRYRYNLDLQQLQLEQWMTQWSRHPAAEFLPRQLQLIASLGDTRPEQIALLLPLQSQAGRVIRNGFMSAYFNARNIGIKVPELRFYDTTEHNDILALHQQAREEGAELIIGPLLKRQVAALQHVRELGVPTLALNTIDEDSPRSNQLYQFSLAPENEARQIARKAWSDGHRRVAILGPVETGGNDYYNRKRSTFTQEWESLGGSVASTASYQNSYTETIEQMLQLSHSQYRHEQLTSLLGSNTEFVPRRRQDIDFIFLLAQPGPARQIIPSLAYLYAGDLPVYATQDVYSGSPRPQADADLNGIHFADCPWLLTDLDELRNEAQRLFPQNSALYSRLQAFGVDAFRLYPRLSQLERLGNQSIPGATGQLHMSADRSIYQNYTWARIRNGLAVITDSPDNPLAQGGAYDDTSYVTPASTPARHGR